MDIIEILMWSLILFGYACVLLGSLVLWVIVHWDLIKDIKDKRPPRKQQNEGTFK
jgi:hypothetical protein